MKTRKPGVLDNPETKGTARDNEQSGGGILDNQECKENHETNLEKQRIIPERDSDNLSKQGSQPPALRYRTLVTWTLRLKLILERLPPKGTLASPLE